MSTLNTRFPVLEMHLFCLTSSATSPTPFKAWQPLIIPTSTGELWGWIYSECVTLSTFIMCSLATGKLLIGFPETCKHQLKYTASKHQRRGNGGGGGGGWKRAKRRAPSVAQFRNVWFPVAVLRELPCSRAACPTEEVIEVMVSEDLRAALPQTTRWQNVPDASCPQKVWMEPDSLKVISRHFKRLRVKQEEKKNPKRLWVKEDS